MACTYQLLALKLFYAATEMSAFSTEGPYCFTIIYKDHIPVKTGPGRDVTAYLHEIFLRV
jgi:hypothetical protein